MTPLPLLSGREVAAVLHRLGWRVVRRSGHHLILVGPEQATTLSVPDQPVVLPGVLRALIQAAGSTADEFLQVAS